MVRPDKGSGASSGANTAFGAGGSYSASLEPYKVVTSHPEQLNRHNISDEELEMIGKPRPDFDWEVMLAASGIAVGSFVPAMASLFRAFWTQTQSLNVEGTLQVVLFFCASAVSTFAFFSTRQKSGSIQDRVDEIRKRAGRSASILAVDETQSRTTSTGISETPKHGH